MAKELDLRGRVRAGEMRQRATSMPSAEVPLMMPATQHRLGADSRGCLLGFSQRRCPRRRAQGRAWRRQRLIGRAQKLGVAQQLVAMRADGCGGSSTMRAEAAGAFRFAQDGFVRGEDERGVFADFDRCVPAAMAATAASSMGA